MTLLPTKHLSLELCGIGRGAIVLTLLEDGMEEDVLYQKFSEHFGPGIDGAEIPVIRLHEALELLVVLGAVIRRDSRVYLQRESV